MLDTFAIVSGHTPIGQLVDTVLSALGLPQLIADSRGLIQLNNWKPLSFETITDNQEELVSTLFKEISSSVTLKILTKSAAADSQGSQCIVEVKQKLLKLALEKQPNILSSTDNNEIKELIQQLIATGEGGLGNLSQSNVNTINEWLDDLVATEGGHRRKNPQTSTRFNQLSEIPRLERWFRNDSNPSKQKLINYMNILNGTPYRRSTSKITYQQMCNWFSNQRASRRSGGGRAAENCDSQYAKIALALSNGSDTSLNGVFNLAKLMGFQPSTQPAAHDSSSSAAAAASASTMNAHNFAANALAKNPFVFSAMASGFDAQLMSQLHPSITSQAFFDAFRASFQQEQDPQQPGSNPTTSLPLSSLPTDIPLKFNGSSRFGYGKLDGINNGGGAVAAATEGHHSGGLHSGGAERIDGGSESPTGNDDASMQSSTSEVGEEGKESDPSTPEGCLDVINPHSPENHPSTLGCSQLQSAAASLLNGNRPLSPSSFSSLLPTMSLLNSTFAAAAASGLVVPGGGNHNNGSSSPVPDSGKLRVSSNSLKTPTSADGDGGRPDSLRSQAATPSSSHPSANNISNSARSRLMFDPLSELPILEKWFEDNPHPGWLQIEKYTETLNSFPYRQNYPPISTHNVKIWFKNRRAKCKRLNLGDIGSISGSGGNGKMLLGS